MDQFCHTLRGLSAEPPERLRAIVLRGEGPAFCAGADIGWMQRIGALDLPDNVADAERMAAMFEIVDRVPVPLVARVHGAALGGGMGLCAVCDVVIADASTRMGFTETRLGIIPAVVAPFVIAKIGESHARAAFLTGERFGAEVALRIGLVQEVSEDAGRAAETIVEAIRQGGPEAVREAKRLVRDRPAGVDTAHIAAARRTSDEGQEGLRAFLEGGGGRRPAWRPERHET